MRECRRQVNLLGSYSSVSPGSLILGSVGHLGAFGNKPIEAQCSFQSCETATENPTPFHIETVVVAVAGVAVHSVETVVVAVAVAHSVAAVHSVEIVVVAVAAAVHAVFVYIVETVLVAVHAVFVDTVFVVEIFAPVGIVSVVVTAGTLLVRGHYCSTVTSIGCSYRNRVFQ